MDVRLLRTIDNRRLKMFRHLIRYNRFPKSIIEYKIEVKRGRGRPRRNYLDQKKGKVIVLFL